jgi:plastocyanin
MNYPGVLLLVILILVITSLNTGLMTVGNSKDPEIKITAKYNNSTTQPSSSTRSNSIFLPTVISLKNDDIVKWINYDKFNHTVSSIFFQSNIIYPKASQSANSTSSVFTYNFSRPGVYVYIDKFHPNIGGVIYVNTSESQRELIPTSANFLTDVKVEMPQNSAYQNKLGSFFIPSFVNVSKGVKVTWTNKDYIPHTATAADGSFDTKPMLTGQSVSEIINATGISAYYCKIHPWMIGIIQVTKAA